jgi:MFS family permease
MTQGATTESRGRRNLLSRITIDVTPLRQSRDWRLLFAGQSFMGLGEQIRVVSVPYLVFLITHSSFAVGLISLAQFLPSLFLSLAGGTLADRMERRKLLIITQALLTLASALLAISVLRGAPPLWFIFIIVPLAAGFQAVENPARRAVVPRLVGMAQLPNALALEQATWNLAAVVGPVLGGLIIAKFGVATALVFSTATLLVTLVLLLPVGRMPVEVGEGSIKSPLASVVEGFAFLKGKPTIISTFLIDLNAMIFGFPSALMPALATQVFKVGPAGLGLLYAAPGAGALLGALFTGWVGRVRRQGRAVIIAVCIWGVALVAFGLITRLFWLALVMLAIAGCADMFSAVFRSTILQLGVPDHLRGRLSAVHFLVVTSGPRLGDMEAGTVAALWGTKVSVVSGGLGSIVGAIAIALAVPAFWRYDSARSPEVYDVQQEALGLGEPPA